MKRKNKPRRNKKTSTALTEIATDVQNPKPKPKLPLPVKILHQICSNLGSSGVAAFRLASKHFAEIGKEHLVEELCFFLHPRSISKVVRIAESPEWAARVKRLVFEHVGIATTETLERQSGSIPMESMRSHCGCFVARSEVLRCQALKASTTLVEAIGRFRNLEAISLHNVFKDIRRNISEDKVSMEGIFDRRSEYHTCNPACTQLQERLLWHDNPSLQIYQPPKRLEAYQNMSFEHAKTLQRFLHLIKLGFNAREGNLFCLQCRDGPEIKENSEHVCGLDLRPRAIKKLDTLLIQTHFPEAQQTLPPERLSRCSSSAYMPYTNGPKTLNIEYFQPAPESLQARSRSKIEYSFGNDVKRLSCSLSGFTGLKRLTMISHADHPSEWLDLSPFG